MSFASPAFLWALAAVPAVLLLHWFRRRVVERRVAALFLFEELGTRTSGGRVRAPIERTASLLLECLLAALLALWLAGPVFGETKVPHVVVVFDGSASMAAEGVLGAAERRLSALLAQRGQDTRLSVVRSDEPPELLLGPRAPAAGLREAMAHIRPVGRQHDLSPALDLARQLAGQGGEIVVVTDGPFVVADARVLACGQPATNAALRSVTISDEGAHGNLVVHVGSHGRATAQLEVAFDDGAPQGVPLTFVAAASGEPAVRRVTVPLPPSWQVARLRLDADALAIDDEAVVVAEPRTDVGIADERAAADRTVLPLDRVWSALSGWRPAPAHEAQLVVRSVPAAPQAIATMEQLEVVLAPSQGLASGRAVERRGPFVLDRGHAWLAGIELADVRWPSGPAGVPGRALIAADGEVLLGEEIVAHGRRCFLDVAGDGGGLVRAPAWPILFHNLVASARELLPGVHERSVRLGDDVVFRRGAGDAAVGLVVVAPSGARTPLPAGRVVAVRTREAGLHRVVAANALGSEQEIDRFAVRFADAHESELRDRQAGEWPPQALVAGHERADDPAALAAGTRRWLGLVLLLLIVADWWVLQRRPT
jgi:hypothetical protein